MFCKPYRALLNITLKMVVAVILFSCMFISHSHIPVKAVEGDRVVLKIDSAYEKRLGYYRFDVEPGQVVNLPFYVENISKTNRRVWVYSSDQLTSTNGGKKYRTPDEENMLYGKWLDLPPLELNLSPGESYTGMAKLTVPTDIRQGQYIAAIALYEILDPIIQQGKDFSLEIPRISITAKQVVMDYEIDPYNHKLNILDYEKVNTSDGYNTFVFDVSNTGDVLEKADAYLELFDFEHNRVGAYYFKTDSLYSSDQFNIEFKHNQLLQAGEYSGTFRLVYSDDKEEVFNFGFEVTEEEFKRSEGAIAARESSVGSGSLLDNEYFLLSVTLTGITVLFVILILFINRSKKSVKAN